MPEPVGELIIKIINSVIYIASYLWISLVLTAVVGTIAVFIFNKKTKGKHRPQRDYTKKRNQFLFVLFIVFTIIARFLVINFTDGAQPMSGDYSLKGRAADKKARSLLELPSSAKILFLAAESTGYYDVQFSMPGASDPQDWLTMIWDLNKVRFTVEKGYNLTDFSESPTKVGYSPSTDENSAAHLSINEAGDVFTFRFFVPPQEELE